MAKRARKYWLMKSEPDVYSIEHLKRDKKEIWEGVRNYQARNFMRDMAVGDLALFYHSSTTPPGVAGICKISKEAYPDPTQFDKKSKYYDAKSKKEDPRWSLVEVAFVEELKELVTLEALKAEKKLEGMLVTKRGIRLSVQPVDKAHFAHILKMASAKTKA